MNDDDVLKKILALACEGARVYVLLLIAEGCLRTYPWRRGRA